jgi:DNA-binding transcriptional LysR family regulator
VVRKIDWDVQIGRRLKLRDLHVFLIVVQCGSMAKAALQLGVSQPAVWEVMADLEQAVRVRLLDRGPRGVEPTNYGRALLERARAAFDELKEGIKTIEHLADPTVGEVRIGCSESLVSAILAPVIPRFCQQYPRAELYVKDVCTPTMDLDELRKRRLDVILARLVTPHAGEDEDLNAEVLFHDEMVVAVGKQSPWARRRGIKFSELVNEPWILTPPGTWNYAAVAEAFRAHKLDMPKICLTTFSLHLRNDLLAAGPFITAYPRYFVALNGDRFSLKVLPVDLPIRPWPVEIITLKNRTLNPVVHSFIDHLRAFANSAAVGSTPEKKSA